MNRPLLITDCDEVLMHMVSHFDAWLGEVHRIHFDIESGSFGGAMTDKVTGATIAEERVWPLLQAFFRTEMHRQTMVPGAVEALGRIGEIADIVILTNVGDEAHPWRVEQLAKYGIAHEVVTNSGGKGPRAREIMARYGATRAAFVDDLEFHHASVAKHAPEIHRLHMISEPRLAPVVPPAEKAHARIDDWPTATSWLLERLEQA